MREIERQRTCFGRNVVLLRKKNKYFENFI